MYCCVQMGIGYLLQEMLIFCGFLVEQNIIVVLELVCCDVYYWCEWLEMLLGEFLIEYLCNVLVMVLLGGECCWVEIVCCFVVNLLYFLLDEFFVGVDLIVVGEICGLVYDLKSCGIGVLIIDYNVCEIFEIVDCVYIFYDGYVLKFGMMVEIVEDVQVWCVYLGEIFWMN